MANAYAQKWCRGRNDIFPDQIATDAVMEAARRFPDCVNLTYAKYTTYLHCIVRNRFLDALRKVRTRQPFWAQSEEYVEVPASSASPEEACLRKEQLSRLRRALKTLSSSEQTILLEVLREIPLAEALRRLGVSRAAYYRWRTKLVARLRQKVS